MYDCVSMGNRQSTVYGRQYIRKIKLCLFGSLNFFW